MNIPMDIIDFTHQFTAKVPEDNCFSIFPDLRSCHRHMLTPSLGFVPQ